MTEKRVLLKSRRDVIDASRSALRIGRQSGLSLLKQFCLAGVIGELGEKVVGASSDAVCVISGESDAVGARVKVMMRGTGDGLPDLAREIADGACGSAPVSARWGVKWRIDEFEAVHDAQGTRISVSVNQPKR